MNKTVCISSPLPDMKAARHQFMELYGSTLVMNSYLKIALLSLSLVVAALSLVVVKTHQLVANFKPHVIRIDQLGRAQAVEYDSFDYHPQEAEIRYFLIQFVEQHYGRIRATVKTNYARSLYFLERSIADAIMEANKKAQTIETFLVDHSDEIEIRVKNVSIEDLRNAPYRATVEFEKVYLNAVDRSERKREKFVGNFVFAVRDKVSNDMIPINPLGLTITYFRNDQAF